MRRNYSSTTHHKLFRSGSHIYNDSQGLGWGVGVRGGILSMAWCDGFGKHGYFRPHNWSFIEGRVNVPYPPPRIGLSRRLMGIDLPFNPILGGSFSFFWLHMRIWRNETKLLIHYTPQAVSQWFPYIQWFLGLWVGCGGEGRDFIYTLMRWIWKTRIFPSSYLLIYWG